MSITATRVVKKVSITATRSGRTILLQPVLVISSTNASSSTGEVKIGKFWFDTTDNVDKQAIEDDNMFRGMDSETRYVVGKVLDAENFDEDDIDNQSTVKIFIDNN